MAEFPVDEDISPGTPMSGHHAAHHKALAEAVNVLYEGGGGGGGVYSTVLGAELSSGRWVGAWMWGGNNNGGTIPTQNKIAYYPAIVPDCNLDQLSFLLADASVGNFAAMAIYGSDGGDPRPGPLIHDAGEVPLDEAGQLYVVDLSIPLQRGVVWFAIHSSVNISSQGQNVAFGAGMNHGYTAVAWGAPTVGAPVYEEARTYSLGFPATATPTRIDIGWAPFLRGRIA